ncbi:MAG TPA: VIT and VWA domain-containing protein [Blastocatellia bacterium]|nr:VIT and VWA domain-containing protein [Blastocatellia bacterium]HMV87690.1 VIT and VWA domain-containing protein [Blastocatellia bacterium]HMX26097.1 VIT and VWA domain-containing protein [Blastocatellia bacterium]HMY75117.1 VIT and VWA domain-containing protein [Blastocatellia bacterium]HMZ22447.1 VIT and VWA domain-containing protein [Blastocatellia bacterium]
MTCHPQKNFYVFCIVLSLMLAGGLVLPAKGSRAQSGVLIPTTIKNTPDDSILSLPVMKVDVTIDNQHAQVRVLQIFDNHQNQTLEGKYLFALPPQSSIADFAVWDGDLRLPGVILEKRRANQLYEQIKAQVTDPGLLQQDDEHGGASAFSAKVFPIPAYGTKRVELEYTEMLPVENLTSRFSFPLKASFGQPQRVGEFSLRVVVLNDAPISPLRFASAYAMKPVKQSASEQEYEFSAVNIELKEDFALEYSINIEQSALSFIAHRAPERISAYDLRDPALAVANPDGYFEARAIFNNQVSAGTGKQRPRNVLLLLDTSLSMHGEKLSRAVEAVDFFLHSLTPQDHFNLALFNDAFAPLASVPLPATTENVERALAFVKASMLGGGTDLNQALVKAVEISNSFPPGEHSIVLISDANPTLKTVSIKRIAQAFDTANNSGASQKTRLYALGIGSDTNRNLLETLTQKCKGYFAQARETEDISAQLKLVFAQIGSAGIDDLKFVAANAANFSQVYSVQSPAQSQHSFDGASVAFVGRYKHSGGAQPNAEVKIQGKFGEQSFAPARRVNLPALETAHEHLPRVWARARVDALLYEMNLNGEREDYIAEIIRLSQKYKFVTPYTAFLAAPRSLLRPRVIQPGDPVIRVKTDPAIKEVFAVLPFGETLPLKFLPGEGVWQARFLAPAWMPDGTYRCRLLMTDKQGNGYQEEKSFVIDSHAPKLAARVDSQTVRAGDEVLVKVNADKDTVRLVAKLYGAQPVLLAWSEKEKASIGRLRVPAGLASGQYALTVSAEDFAHNQAGVDVMVSVIGR